MVVQDQGTGSCLLIIHDVGLHLDPFRKMQQFQFIGPGICVCVHMQYGLLGRAYW